MPLPDLPKNIIFGFDDLDIPLIPTGAGESLDTTVAAKTGPKCHAKILGMTRVSFCSWLYALVGLIWIGKNAPYCSLYGLFDFTSTNKCFFPGLSKYWI